MATAASSAAWLEGATDSLRPPPKLTLSEWADEHFRLSAESAAEPGRWRTLPYQRGILDAITDPAVERVSVMKSARVGYTKCINAAIAFFMAQDPCPILVVQPTVEDAEGYSKEEIAPMLRDVEALAGLVTDTAKTSAQTILHKSFPGGVLSMVGANSGRGFRRVSRRVVIFDEVDGYPHSAGAEGDPIKLGEKRAEYYWNRKIVAGSTPLVAGASRIEELFQAGDQRRYYVPCPHCGHMDFLRFSAKGDDGIVGEGHVMKWHAEDGSDAYFRCSENACRIDEDSKRGMIELGEWRAAAEFNGHASFHIWAAYSLSPNATWAQLAAEFLEAKKRPETLRTFVNTALGETWKERGEAPDWERLFERRETYKLGTVPAGVVAITAGVDVQKDRFVYEVVGWSPTLESWPVDVGEILGDTADPETWKKLDELRERTYTRGDDVFAILKLGIDSGYNTQMVYAWTRGKPNVMATKGTAGARSLVGQASPVDVKVNGKRYARGAKVFPVGVDVAKGELYAWLGLARGAGDPPRGYCHFPELSEGYFQQLTAEHLVPIRDKRTNRIRLEWHVQPGRENHYLDCRIIARVAAAVIGVERMVRAAQVTPKPAAAPPQGQIAAAQAPKREGFWNRPPTGWLSRRRR